MTEIIMVRHGETKWNAENRLRGRIDIELNENGLRQAKLLGEYLGHKKIQAIYSSPVLRAISTAEAIARYHNIKVEKAPGINDLDFGEWQGLTFQEVREKDKQTFDKWMENPHEIRVPGGETLDEVRIRATALVNELVLKYEGAVVLVSHRVVNMVLICALLGLDNSHFHNIRLDTCGITTFTHTNNRFILDRHNDTSFLGSLP